jgi:NhaP-type Na+/H+ and K+/H+ antiporter
VAFSTTLPPVQKVVGPPAVMATVGALFTTTLTADDTAEQPDAVRCTV